MYSENKMPIKAILFDMFDTLMIIQKEHAFYSPAVKNMYNFLAQNGVQSSFPEFRDAYIKARDALYEEADKKFEEPHFSIRVKNALENLGYIEPKAILVQGATEAFCDEFRNYVAIDADAYSTVEALHNQYQLGLVSNFAIPECVEKLLHQHKMNDFFSVVVVSAAVNRRKPCPDIFLTALQKMNVSAQEAVFVGDTVDADVIGPKQVGLRTIYIDRRPQKELENNLPDQIIKALSQLPAAIEKLEK
jgi:putative hydrolase of the HAD superfamily